MQTIRLDVAVTASRTSEGPADPEQAFNSLLTWTDSTVAYDDSSGRRVVLDFQKFTCSKYDFARRTVATFPIVQRASYNAVEARNRAQHIYEVMVAAGIKDNDFAPVLVEHQLSANMPELGSGPSSELKLHDGVWRARGRELLSTSRDTIKQALAVGPFLHFLRTEFGGHPAILDRLRVAGGVPAVTTIGSLMPKVTAGVATIRASEEREARPRAIDSSKFETLAELGELEPIDVVLRGTAWRTVGRSVAARFEEARAGFRGPNALEALLAIYELTLECSVPPPAAVGAAWNACTDERVHGLQRVIEMLPTLKSKDDAQKVLSIFAGARQAVGRSGYVLGAFEAIAYRILDDDTHAAEALTQVLTANPRFTGAYKDLGDIYADKFDFTRAWACWRRAQAIDPSHSLVRDINAFEAVTMKEQPEYFRLR